MDTIQTPSETPTTTVELVEANTESKRQLATVQKILSLEPIDGADRIEVATILGWHCVVQKGLHKVGDLVVYCEVDSVLPDRPEFEWMRSYNFRVKTIKLRKQISEGIVLPIRELPNTKYNAEDCLYDYIVPVAEGERERVIEFLEGTDVTDLLGVTKYIRPDPTNGQVQIRKGRPDNWPRWVHKTDELRVQGVYKYVEPYLGKEFYWSEKMDGQSMTCYLKDGEFGVCSRNYDLEPATDGFWKVAIDGKVEAKLRQAFTETGKEFAVQGERCGPGVQGNKLKLEEVKMYVFNVFNITDDKYLDYQDMLDFCTDLGLTTVPMGGTFTLNHTCDQLVEFATKRSSLNPKIWVEGVVFRSVIEEDHQKLGGRVSFKAINPQFKLEYGE